MSLRLSETRELSLSLPKCCNFTPRNVHGRFQTHLTLVLTIFTDFLSAVDVRNTSNCFTLRWQVLSSEVAKLKWFCFDLALKLALYTYKKKLKKAKKQSQYSVCYLQGQVKMASVTGQC